MSVVGPRPHMLAHTEYYSNEIEEFMIRHKIKPGITGWAQIHGHRGPTNKIEDMRKRVIYDVWYVENWSLPLDIKCIYSLSLTRLKARKMHFKNTLLFLLVSFSGALLGQSYNQNQLDFNENTILYGDAYHQDTRNVGIYPFSQYAGDSLSVTAIDSLDVTGWVWRKAFNEHLLSFGNGIDYKLNINPYVNFTIGSDNNIDKPIHRNGRGFLINGTIGKNFFFETDLQETQETFAQYLKNDPINENRGPFMIRGHGIGRKFKDSGRDYTTVNSRMGFRFGKYFDVTFGRGKHFWGFGHRSLLLSDNSYGYPYFKLNTKIGIVNYTNLFAQLRETEFQYQDETYVKKFQVSHMLSFDIAKKLQIGIFESVVYADPLGNRGLEWDYLNPIIFYRPIEFALGSGGGNVLMGLNAVYDITDDLQVYGQFALDEFRIEDLKSANGSPYNKIAFQLGTKYHNIAGVKNLNALAEFNYIRPYMYSHYENDNEPNQNYAHYGQSMAHPQDANLYEVVFKANYRYKRYFAETSNVIYEKGFDAVDSLNWGGDIFKNYQNYEVLTGNKVGQGLTSNMLYSNWKLGYIVNPNYNLRFYVDYTYRSSSNPLITVTKPEQTHMIGIGLATSIYRETRDF